MADYNDYNNLPPQPKLLTKQIEAVNDPSLYKGLADFNPLGLGMTNLSQQQRQRFEDAGLEATDFEGRGLFGNLFPRWALSDALKQKRNENRSQLKPALGAREQGFIDQRYQTNVKQSLQKDDAQMQFDFATKRGEQDLAGAKELATQQIRGASDLAEQQGKLNMRQSMLNSVNERALAITSTPFRRLTQ